MAGDDGALRTGSGEAVPARVEARAVALFSLAVLGCAAGSLSQTAVNAMLGLVGADLGVSTATAQWATTIYMLTLGVVVPPVTYLSARLSMRRLMLLSSAFMLAGALVALAAPWFWLLVAGRVIQAIGAGVSMPLMQTVAMTRFPPGRTATAMGVGGIAMGFAPNIGPSIGGAMADVWGWRSFFVLLAGVMLVLCVACALLVREDGRPARPARFETPSFLFSTFGFGGVLLGLTNASSYGLASPLAWAPAALGAACVAGFVVRQSRVENPLIHIDIFKAPGFGAGFAAQCLLFASFMGVTLVVPMFVQQVIGGTVREAGMVFVPATVASLVANPASGALADRFGARPVVISAGCLLVLGAGLTATLGPGAPTGLVAAFQTVRTLGVSSLIGPLTSWTLRGLPRALVMDGSSFSTTCRQVAASVGTAVMVLIVTALPTALGVSAATAFRAAFGFSCACAVAMLVLAVARVRG